MMLPLRNTRTRYGLAAIALHWLTAALVLGMIGLGLYMEDLPRGPEMFRLYGLHKSIGMTVLVLLLLRLAWKAGNPSPERLGPAKRWETALSHVVHAGLYVALLGMPLAGWVASSAANFPVSYFGLFTLPNLVAPSEALQDRANAVHYYLSRGLIALLLLHVAGALKHHLVYRDGTLRRMLGMPAA